MGILSFCFAINGDVHLTICIYIYIYMYIYIYTCIHQLKEIVQDIHFFKLAMIGGSKMSLLTALVISSNPGIMTVVIHEMILGDLLTRPTWWLIPLSKWVITTIISGLTLLIPFITGVITHLLSGMNHQVLATFSPRNEHRTCQLRGLEE